WETTQGVGAERSGYPCPRAHRECDDDAPHASAIAGISQPIPIERRTYGFSKELRHWQKGSAVKFRASAKAETLSNPLLSNGLWTVLYEQNDRIYRAILQPAP
ncbi:MAG: hypothetical protein VXZ53_03215, partial [Planctomycetota bacterium]|nr:hypothetical protein [Planctomycetota bacterium]